MPGAAGDPLLELVAVMRRLRAECPWKAAQTHRSLARYLAEELHETLEAIDLGDVDLLREELGDLLLQVVFHAAIAEQAGAFDLDDVAAGLVAKLVRRNPHVFGPAGEGVDDGEGVSAAPADAAAVNELWESVKATEKQRTDLTEGLPPGLPALLHADKVLDRLARRDGTSAVTQAAPGGPTFLLVPSPFLGPATWAPVAWWLRGRGTPVVVAGPPRSPVTPESVVASVLDAAASVTSGPLVLVVHSNAGLHAPHLATLLGPRVGVAATVYVDAALAGSKEWAELAPQALRDHLADLADADGLLPPWTAWWPAEAVDDLVPDRATRAAVEAEQQRVPAAYLSSTVPVPPGWREAPAAYLALGETYAAERDRAVADGWPVMTLAGGHLHTVVDPAAVGAAVLDLVDRVLPGGSALGGRLLALVGEAHAAGVDPEQALRDAVRRLLAVRGSGTVRGTG